jgi:hypothetical protein
MRWKARGGSVKKNEIGPSHQPGWSFHEFHEAGYHAAYHDLDPKYAAYLYSLFQGQIQGRAELAAKAAREATPWFRFKTRMSTALKVVGSLLSIGVSGCFGAWAFYDIAASIKTPFEWTVTILLVAILFACQRNS